MRESFNKITEKKPRGNGDQVTSVNNQGGIHQQGGGSSSGIIQGGESDISMENHENKPSS